MRSSISLAVLLLAATAPLSAQPTAPLRHGDGYEISLPARFRAETPTSETMDGYLMQMSTFATDEDNEGVIVIRLRFQELGDTTLATRRAMLQLGRVGMLQAAGEVALQGEPRDFERGDRVGMRVPIQIDQQAKCGCGLGHGLAELSVARQGRLEMWMVMYVRVRSDLAASSAAGERVLDTFRLTGEQSAAAGDEAVRGSGFVELTDIKSKPRP